MGRAPCCSKVGLNRGPWSIEEDKLLIHYIQTHGEGHWRALPCKAGLLRCGKSCRLRWVNYLRPGVKRGNFTAEENERIIRLHSDHGNRWSLIAAEFPGRTDNEIKNHWNTHLRKKAPINITQPNTSVMRESSSSVEEEDDRPNPNDVASSSSSMVMEQSNKVNGAAPASTSSSGTSDSYSSMSTTTNTEGGEVSNNNMNMVVTDTFFYELDDLIDVDQKTNGSASSASCYCYGSGGPGTKQLESLYMEYLQLLNYGLDLSLVD